MGVIKKIFKTIFEPFYNFGSKGYSEQLSKFFVRHKYIRYILALIISILAVGIYYFL